MHSLRCQANNILFCIFIDGWVGIVRVCYRLGSLSGINETNGCKQWTNDEVEGYTALYCFCDTDYCNLAVTLSATIKLLIAMFLMYIIIC